MVATFASAIARQKPAMNGWSMPAPAPCARTSVAIGFDGRIHAVSTVAFATSSRLRASGEAMPESSQMGGTLYLGTSGFSYDEWKHGVFYPEGLKNREMLSYYASRLPSVEINYTFRRFPTERALTTWREETPESFRFTLKANQRITHFKKLRDVDDDVRDFLKAASTLGERLGTVLYQCPPTLQYDRSLI